MTAIISVLRGWGAALVTDAASFEPDGTLSLISSKQIRRPEYQWACTSAGPTDLRRFFEAEFGDYQSIDAIIPDLLCWSEGMQKIIVASSNFAHFPYFAVYLIGYSHQRQQFETWSMASDCRDGPRAEREPPVMTAIGFDIAMEEFITDSDCEPQLDIYSAFAAQRERGVKSDVCDGRLISIGGYLEITKLSRAGMSTERICEWADVPGRPIDTRILCSPIAPKCLV